MKVLLLAQSAGVGGVESSFVNFVNHVVSRGHDVTVVFWRDCGPAREALPPQVRVIDVQRGFARGVYRTGNLRDAWARPTLVNRLVAVSQVSLRRILQLYRNPWVLLNRVPEHFDIGIAFRHQGYGPYYLADKVDASKRIMWFHHGSYTPSRMGRKVDERYFGRMDQIVAVSNWTRDVLIDAFPALVNRVTVIGNLIDEGEVLRKSATPTPGSEHPGVPTLVTVSRLSEEKGLDLAIETASILRGRGLQFVWWVIGDGPERTSLERSIDEKGLGGHVALVGEQENPFPYVAAADVYVQTSRVEAYGLAIAEAIILEKPVVVSAIPSAEEVLTGGEFGVTCLRDPESFADAISGILTGGWPRQDPDNRLARWRDRNAEIERLIDEILTP